ncbi:UvrD-helicase domain-containing protein [Candidatus Sumerlaeota bacterium]|nr:UvrD-helicase domain-containing protein [Candidatus Sumerlaeota bacterium]
MKHPELLQDLNPPQREAVTTTEGPLLVIAGAGSGKTRVITHRIAWLVAELGVAPDRILGTTFTNKAAREMKARVARLCRAAETVRLPLATFHSHCARILRADSSFAGLTARFTICDETDQTAVMRDCIKTLGCDPKTLDARGVLDAVSLAKMKMLDGDEARDFLSRAREDVYADLYTLYERRLRENDAVDFDDLLLKVVEMWQDRPSILARYREQYLYLLVDEYQDTNEVQFEWLRLLSAERGNLCVVGDEDQSIYSWRGARIDNLLEFQNFFPKAKTIRLEQNYRSTRRILEAASGVIARNTQRLGKTLWSDGEEGDPILEIDAQSEFEEARRIVDEILYLYRNGLPLEEIAVFYRINSLSRIYEDALREADIPYRVVGGLRFYDRAEIKDLLAYLHVVANPNNALALLRVINKPRRGIGSAALSKIVNFADENRLALIEAIGDSAHLTAARVKGKAAEGALELAAMVEKWRKSAAQKLRLKRLVKAILDDTGYEASLGDPRSIDAMSRIENIREFVGSLDDFQKQDPDADLGDYLESIALKSAEEKEDAGSGVSLMTVHNAKGLEFDVVFVVAVEKDLFPNARAVREQGDSEEERRLFYVALTRARRRVYLSHTSSRRLWGETQWPRPSVFLSEIPRPLLTSIDEIDVRPLGPKTVESKSPPRGAQTQRRSRFLHEVLGPVVILAEEGTGSAKRYRVRDESGEEHTLLARGAHLKAIDRDSEDDAPPEPPTRDDEMPF